MSKYTVAQIKNWDVDTETPSRGWIPARPLNPTGIITRCRHALGVLTGRYDVLDWEHEAFAVENECAVAEIERLREEVALERNLKADSIHACALANIRAEQLGEAPIKVIYCDGNGAGRSRPEDCRYGVSYVTVADTVYWPLTPEEAQRLRSAECGMGDFTGPGTPTNVAHLVEALEDIRSRSSINLAMRSDTFELTARLGDIYQIADAALAQEG